MSYQYKIVEIFESLQGEGYYTGTPCIFLRFGECNLRCSWCDTNYNRFMTLSTEEILEKIQSFSSRTVVVTGGEPCIQPHLEDLLQHLKDAGYRLHIETNGLEPVSPLIDYIATSPKALYIKRYMKSCIEHADEVRIVVDGDVTAFCELIEQRIHANRYYLSPCEKDGEINIYDTIKQIGILNHRSGDFPHWQLSIQTHKFANIP